MVKAFIDAAKFGLPSVVASRNVPVTAPFLTPGTFSPGT